MSEKQHGFTRLAAESRLLRDIQEKVQSCMQCGTCSGSCANSFAMDLERGNNLGIPKDDFLFFLADLSKEMDEDEGFPGFYVPVDKKGANVLVTINSKEPFGEPDDMKFWWRIFYAAREDWTVPSENWERGSTGVCFPVMTSP